jgi:hypothetical protein
MITFDLGCKAGQVDINCTNATCHGTPSNMSIWGPRWFPRFGAWFDALKAKYPSLLWINNGPYPGDNPEKPAFRGMGAALLDATRYQATPSRYYTPRFVYGGCYREGVVDPTSSINTLPSHIIGAM